MDRGNGVIEVPCHAAGSGSAPGADERFEPRAARLVHRLADTLTSARATGSKRAVNLDPGHLRRNRILAIDRSEPAAAAFDILRTQVLQRMDAHGWRTLGITSPKNGMGKTVVAINIAASVARMTERRSLLVEFDLRKPQLAEYMGIPLGNSINTLLDADFDVSAALAASGLPRLTLLPASCPVENSSEVLASGRIASMISEIRDRYADRVVIFDLPPLLHGDDALSVLPRIDCVLMVIGDGMSGRSEIEESLRLLRPSNLVGVALNQLHVKSAP